MKVLIGKYPEWIGPYQIAEKLLFWMDKHNDERVHNFGTWLATDTRGNDSWLTRVCQWISAKNKRQIYVRVDKYDSWSADHTLALIIAPVLKQLQLHKHGAPNIDDNDVPEGLNLRSYETDKLKASEWEVDDNHFKRWDWVLAEMIWAFEQLSTDDSTSKFFKDSGAQNIHRDMNEWMSSIEIDHAGLNAHQARIDNGTRLFGKYYQALWD